MLEKKVKLTTSFLSLTDYITPLFESLHWLPVTLIQYKVNNLCYNCIMCTAPTYLCDSLQLYILSCTACSASDTLSPQIPCINSTVSSCAISVLGPLHGMLFPVLLDGSPPSLDSFRSDLMTFRFPKDLPCFQLGAAVFLHLESFLLSI